MRHHVINMTFIEALEMNLRSGDDLSNREFVEDHAQAVLEIFPELHSEPLVVSNSVDYWIDNREGSTLIGRPIEA